MPTAHKNVLVKDLGMWLQLLGGPVGPSEGCWPWPRAGADGPQLLRHTCTMCLHPWKLTWNPKMGVWKVIFLFISGWFSGSMLIFPGCIFCFLKLVTSDLWWCKATLKSGWCIENTDTTTLYNNGSFTMVERHHFGDKFSRTGAQSVAFGSSTKALHLRTSASAAGFSFHFPLRIRSQFYFNGCFWFP